MADAKVASQLGVDLGRLLLLIFFEIELNYGVCLFASKNVEYLKENIASGKFKKKKIKKIL